MRHRRFHDGRDRFGQRRTASDVAWQGRTVRTAVWKKPVTGRIFVGRLNLDGDGQVDLRAHVRVAWAQTGNTRPGFFGAKDIGEAGLIYGLPIVMNYAVMYEYAVDRNSGQYDHGLDRNPSLIACPSAIISATAASIF